MTITADASFEVLPFTRTCRHIWEDGDHVLIGVSPGNSYFSAERIAGLARWAPTRFIQVEFVYADLHVDRMFAAFGHTREHAERRAAKEIKAVRRRILKGVTESGPPEVEIRVRALPEFQSNPVYQLLHRRVLHSLETDEEFRKGCEEMALHFVGSKLPEGVSVTDEQLRVCFDYMAAELPFFVDTPSILDVPSSVAAHHVRMPLTDVLFARGGGLRATRNQAYAVVRPEATAPGSAADHAPTERTVDGRRQLEGSGTGERPLLDFPLSRRGDVLPQECAWLREKAPVARVRTLTGDPAWLVSTYALAKQVLEDERFSLKDTANAGVPRQYALTIPPEVVNNMGNINSAGLRNAVMKALNPRQQGLRDLLRARAGELLDALVAEGGPADLRAGFADPFSAALHCQVLGVPFEDRRRLMSGLDVAFMTAREPFADSALNWYKDVGYFADRLHDQLALAPEERTGLLGRFAGLKEANPESAHLTDEMFATVAVSLFGAGAVSTSAFLTLAVLALLQRPELIGYLRRHPERTAGAVEELLRWNLSVGDGLPRIALADVQVGDVLVREGELVLVLLEGANFDPEVFERPDELDLERESANPHLAFGAGRHFCPASALGRAHAEIALEVLVERLPGLRLAVPSENLVWRTGFIKRLPERLPVAW